MIKRKKPLIVNKIIIKDILNEIWYCDCLKFKMFKKLKIRSI
jgi:hypothetical protein